VQRHHNASSLGILALVALPLVCCGLPVLAAAGALAATGSWLTAHGVTLAGAVVLATGVGLAARWWVARRRCEVPPAEPRGRSER
jgi:membrane protein implicated in regulation of membrane protease activity